VEDLDLALEFESIAARTDESVRRVRARVEKEGLAEGLAEQILERKTIDRILEFAKEEVIAYVEETSVETLDETATAGGLVESPEEGAEPAAAESAVSEPVASSESESGPES